MGLMLTWTPSGRLGWLTTEPVCLLARRVQVHATVIVFFMVSEVQTWVHVIARQTLPTMLPSTKFLKTDGQTYNSRHRTGMA